MFSVQYPKQFSIDLLEILATHVQHRFEQTNVGSTNTTRVNAFYGLLLPSKHY